MFDPSTKGRFPPPNRLSPFELPPVSFCSRPDVVLILDFRIEHDFESSRKKLLKQFQVAHGHNSPG
jgi:hypothetical protein